jgi:hypothetical protein
MKRELAATADRLESILCFPKVAAVAVLIWHLVLRLQGR